MNLVLLTLLACGGAVAPVTDCETLDETTCEATRGCFPITARLIDCEGGSSTQAYAGCMAPRNGGNGDSALACEDMSFYCQTEDTPGAIWFFHSLCVPESIVCTGGSAANGDAAACADVYGD